MVPCHTQLIQGCRKPQATRSPETGADFVTRLLLLWGLELAEKGAVKLHGPSAKCAV